jgi:dihydroorotate dehydrogenase (NAD+) catalytic subunit
MKPDLRVYIGKLRLKNPLMVASGTFGYAEEFQDFLPLAQLGAVVTKTVTLQPRQGNPPPRTCETPAGMLNSIGLENPGLERFILDKLPLAARPGAPVIVSIASEDDPAEFIELTRRLDKVPQVSAIELNISCPNIQSSVSGLRSSVKNRLGLISQDAEATHDLVKKVRRMTKKPLITKLSPNVTDIAEIARAAESAGSDALSLINTLTGMSIEVKSRQPKIAAACAGLSGPAIRPIAVRMVWEVYRKVKIPVIGMGGIMDTESALEFFSAGATAVSVGTANFINPSVAGEIINGVTAYLKQNKINSIGQLTGSLRL